MISKNQANNGLKTNFSPITGDSLVSKTGNQGAYASGWERVFGNKEEVPFDTEFVEDVLPNGIIGDEV